MPSRSRRALLRAIGAAAVGLAGCQESAEPTATESPTPTPSPTESATPTGTPTDSPTPTASLRCGPGPRPEVAWPLPARSATNDAYAEDGPVFEDAPSVDWTVDPSVPEDAADHAHEATFRRPLVAGGTVHVVRRIPFGTMVNDPGGHALQARDPATGELRWSYALPKTPTAHAVRGDTVLAASRNEPLYAVDAQDGTERWTREFESWVDAVVPTPEHIYVEMVGGASRDAELHALAPDGTTRWSHGFADGIRAMAVGSDNVYVGLWGGAVHAFERPDGAPAWSGSALPDGKGDGPAFVESIVVTGCAAFATTGDHVTAFDADGQRRWRVEADFETILATDGETLYGASHGDREDDWDRALRALDVASGEPRWEQAFTVAGGSVLSDGALYQPLDDGLVAVAPDDGAELWRTTPKIAGLALGGDALYGTAGGNLVALR